MTCGNGQKHALTRDDATCQRSSTRVISQQNASYARPGTRGDEGPRTRTQPIIRTVKADVGNPHADVPFGDTLRNGRYGAVFGDPCGLTLQDLRCCVLRSMSSACSNHIDPVIQRLRPHIHRRFQ